MSVESTNIPHHLEQMIEVLQQEEQENGVGSAVSHSICVSYRNAGYLNHLPAVATKLFCHVM